MNNEYLLLIVIIAILVITQFLLRKIANPSLFYVRAISGLLLLLLIWLGNPEKKAPIRIVMTVIVLASIYSNYREMKRVK